MPEPPQAGQDPGEERCGFEVEVLDELECNRRPEDHHREPERDALAAPDASGEQQQREAREHRARAAAQRDARGQERFQDLAAGLMLDKQCSDDVEHTADHQQSGKEPAHPAPLEPEFEPHMTYNGKVEPKGSGGLNNLGRALSLCR